MASSASELNSKKCLLKTRYNSDYAKTAGIIGMVNRIISNGGIP